MYAKVTNGTVDQFPYTIGQLRRDNPNTSFPKSIPESTMNEWGVVSVSALDVPDFDPRTHLVEQDSTPVLSDGVWSIGWSVVAKSAEEVAKYDSNQELLIRNDRDAKLKETDFYALSDVTLTDEMAAYRQALRDITSHANFPYLSEEDWPVKP